MFCHTGITTMVSQKGFACHTGFSRHTGIFFSSHTGSQIHYPQQKPEIASILT
jgi:hypothetical protein